MTVKATVLVDNYAFGINGVRNRVKKFFLTREQESGSHIP
jgi:hypothetical protein